MRKGLKFIGYSDKIESQTRNILKYMISIRALVAINLKSAKYPQTLAQPRRPAGSRAFLLVVVTCQAVSLYSGFIPAKFSAYAQSLNIELSTGRLEATESTKMSRTSCRGGGNLLGEMTNTEPQFEVVKARDQEVYLATLSRNGISVSEEIPRRIFDDDIPDHELANFWFKVRRRLSSHLRLAEQT